MGALLNDIEHSIENMIEALYPASEKLAEFYYTIPDLATQITFELIKEDYRAHASRQSIQSYIDQYDPDSGNRKYTRAIQYAQFFRNIDNDLLNETFGIRNPELEAKDMSGQKRFQGYSITLWGFLSLKLHTECRLFTKILGGQIWKSKYVSESDFKDLFQEYHDAICNLEPPINKMEDIVPYSLVLYGVETYFHINFLYEVSMAAGRHGYPKQIPVDRILSVCQLLKNIPPTIWSPEVYMADCNIIPKRKQFADDIFTLSDEEWLEKDVRLIDCKQIKTMILQRLMKALTMIGSCTEKEKADFIIENYWIWDTIPDFEWPKGSISYYRKICEAFYRKFEKPSIP